MFFFYIGFRFERIYVYGEIWVYFLLLDVYVGGSLVLRNVNEGIIFVVIDFLNVWLKEFINFFFFLELGNIR